MEAVPWLTLIVVSHQVEQVSEMEVRIEAGVKYNSCILLHTLYL